MSSTAIHAREARSPREASTGLIDALRARVERFPHPDEMERFGALLDWFGDAQVVPLGDETPHGAPETYPFGL